jgi:hypothetical protein
VGKILALTMIRRLYYDPSKPSTFSTQQNLENAVGQITGKQKQKTDIKTWVLKQDTYTLHRPVRKRFPRNPYTVNNITDVGK